MTTFRKLLMIAGAATLISVAGFGYAQHGAFPPPKVAFAGQSQVVPFELHRGNRIVVKAKVNGRETQGILDSAAGTTAIDKAYARSIGIPPGQKINARGTGGVVEAELVSGISLTIGGMRFDDMTVAVIDLQPVAQGIGRPVNVIIGRELFNSAVISIDWAASQLSLSSPDAFRPPHGSTAIPLGQRGPFNTIPVSVGGTDHASITALLDVGNGGNIVLPRDYWSKREDITRLRFAESRGGGVGGLHPTRKVILPAVQLGSQTFRNVPADLGDSENEGHATQMANVGIGLLKQFQVDLDLGRQRIYLTPRRDAPGFDRDRAGSRFDLHGDRLKVAFVSPQGPTAAAGLKAGDEIIAVDGRKVTPAYYTLPDWTRGEPGRDVELTLADGRKLKVKLADYY